MKRKSHAIITASDANCGDFLASHWLKSLRENVDLERIDVVVLDFGLTSEQRAALRGATIVPAGRGRSVNVSRRMEMTRFLAAHDYDQVLAVDCGDLVFQGDISHLFEDGKDSLRGVPERYPIPLVFLLRGTRSGLRRSIRERLRGRPMVNGGFLLGPSKKLRDLGEAVQPHAGALKHDQPLVSCLLHDWGFEALDETYNFVLWTARRGFYVEGGIFYAEDGEKLRVVHNTGLKAPFRVVGDFGYGPACNRRVRTPHLKVAATYGRLRSIAGGFPGDP